MKTTYYYCLEYYDELHGVWIPSKAVAGYFSIDVAAAHTKKMNEQTTSTYRYVAKEYDL